MRLVVIGGTGFIGPFIVSALSRLGHEAIVFHRGHAPMPAGAAGELIGDRRTLESHAAELRALAPDVVIDVVLSSGAQAETAVRAFRGAARRFVAVSSMDVYRACGVLHRLEPGPLEPLPLTEESPVRTRLQTYPPERIRLLQAVFAWLDDEYDKIPVERAVMAAGNDLPATVLRLPMVYGPGDPLHRLHPILKRIDDRRPAIFFSSSMAGWRGPRGYVENVAAAIALAAVSEVGAGRVYNVAERESFSELDWARLVAAQAGWRGEFIVLPDERAPAHLQAPGNAAQHWIADTSRIRRELGYREPVPRGEALRRTIAWERGHPPADVNPAAFDYAAEDAAWRGQ